MKLRASIARGARQIGTALQAAIGRLDKSLSPKDTFHRLRQHKFVLSDLMYIFHLLLATFWLIIMESPAFPLKLLIPILYAAALIIPFTSQFFVPATPIFSWLITYYSSRYIPENYRPTVSVVTLPTLESALYGANVSDILTHFTHPILDIIAWLPYGVIHFTLPFVVAAFLWLFRPKQALHLWACAFGYMNLVGVLIQDLFPCSSPWYEVIHGLTPANYSMLGSPGGLHRIDDIFHSSGYTLTFSHAPVIFGAFPSLHAGCATMEALFMSHFFPATTKWIWGYVGVLCWATMYLTHHYLIDLVGGACLTTAIFYLCLSDEFKGANATASPNGWNGANGRHSRRSKYDLYDLDDPRVSYGVGRRLVGSVDFDVSSELSDRDSDEEEVDITYRSPVVSGDNDNSKAPSVNQKQQRQSKKSHRHTASIASLVRADERVDNEWSPIGSPFSFPSTPIRPERTMEEGRSGRGS
jgi:inositol phosphorylceramide synthase catalytic subunit